MYIKYNSDTITNISTKLISFNSMGNFYTLKSDALKISNTSFPYEKVKKYAKDFYDEVMKVNDGIIKITTELNNYKTNMEKYENTESSGYINIE